MFGLSLLETTAVGLLVLFGASGGAYVWGYERGQHIAILEMQAASVKAIAKAAADARLQQMQADKITYNISLSFAEEQQKIVGLTITQIREIPVYVSPKADAACVVNTGFVLMHDAAARGDKPASAISAGGPGALDTPSAVRLSDVEATVTVNYGKYRQIANELSKLQEWVRAQTALHK